VVVGAGIAGLAAAAAVAPFFDEVVVVEKDELPSAARQRRGVAQGQHIHVLLKGGETFLERLLPGIRSDFLAADACEIKDAGSLLHFERGHWFPRRDLGHTHLCLSRPAYERALRVRVKRIANVTIRDRETVDALVIDDGNVTGVRGKSGQLPFAESADLFVFATGRSGILPQMLVRAGLREVPTTTLLIDVHYATGRFKKPNRYRGDATHVVCFPEPPHSALGLLVPVENDEWLIALGGRLEQKPPIDLEGFRSYAASLPIVEIADRVRDAELVEPVRAYRVRSSTWWHYDRYAGLPNGLIPIGDSIASYNPTFAQGMSVACGHSVTLRNSLAARAKAGQGLEDLAADYFPEVMELTAQGWNTAAIVDLEYPQTQGTRPKDFDKRLAWAEAMRRAARRHAEVHKLRFEIGHLLSPASAARDGPLASLIAAELPTT
jgi:2-polyprenyl-6-methoxyphenol hydroxylase-like FAD-dependent oxidoreductase